MSSYAGRLLRHLLWPRPRLERELTALLSVGGYHFSPRPSGRSALHDLAVHLGQDTDGPVALVPDYICNVVPRAVRAAGYEVVEYPTDDRHEVRWEVLSGLLDRHRPRLVVVASVFGSSALLDVLAGTEVCHDLRERGVSVIVDLAQDVRLRSLLPPDGTDVVHAVVSFNSKSFPGAMGGGVLSASLGPARQPRPPTGAERRLLWRSLGAHLRAAWFGRTDDDVEALEYSTCTSFPYRIEREAIRLTRLQTALAVAGVRSLDRFEARKRRLLERGVHVATAHADTAPFVTVRSGVDGQDPVLRGQRRKAPYAMDDEPGRSRRPDDTIVHNKGFLDRRVRRP